MFKDFEEKKKKNGLNNRLKKELKKQGNIKVYENRIECVVDQEIYDRKFKNTRLCHYHLKNGYASKISYIFKNIDFDKPVYIIGRDFNIRFENCNFYHGFSINVPNLNENVSFQNCNFIEDEKSKKVTDCLLELHGKNVELQNCQIFVSKSLGKIEPPLLDMNIEAQKVKMENCKITVDEKVNSPFSIKANLLDWNRVRIELNDVYIEVNSIQNNPNNKILARKGMLVYNKNYDLLGNIISPFFVYNGVPSKTLGTTIREEDNALAKERQKIIATLRQLKEQCEQIKVKKMEEVAQITKEKIKENFNTSSLKKIKK